MKLAIAVSLAALCACSANAADKPTLDDVINDAQSHGKMVSTITPVYSQLIKFAFPVGFHGVTQKTNGKFFILELVPQKETADSWTQMVTLTGMQGLAANPELTPQLLANRIGGGFQKACPDTFSIQALGPIQTNGVQPREGFAVVSSCGAVKYATGDHSETALIIAIKGVADYYTVQWAERGPCSQKIDLGNQKWPKRLTQLKPLVVCSIIPGEQPPYPSCADQK